MKAITGYRLHKERLLFSGGQVVRTIKYPLVLLNQTSQKSNEFLKEFEKGIIEDDLKVRGNLNLNDYLKNKDSYTLFDFWKDSLKAGVIWMPKPKDLIDFLNQAYISSQGNQDCISKIWENASEKITAYFEKDKFKEILKSIPVRKGRTTKESFYQRLVNCANEDFLTKNEKGNYEVNNQELKKTIDSIVNTFFDQSGNLVLEGKKNQSKFWKEKFKLDVSCLQSAQPRGEYKGITFVIIPELIELEKDSSLYSYLNKRKEWLDECYQKTGVEKDLETILGLSNEFNALSNYLGKVLKGLQDGKIEEIYEAKKTIYPQVEKNSDKVKKALEFLAEKAKKIGKTKLPNVNGWHEYRSVLGGKIKSWFSNYQNREKTLDETIVKFKNSLEKAKKYLNQENFPEESKVEKETLYELLDILEQFLESKEESIKDEQNYLLFDSILALLKRRLNFFYQVYIKKELEEEPINEFEDFKGIYQKIPKPVAFYGDSVKRINEKFIYKTIPILKDGIENIKKLVISLKEAFSPKEFLVQQNYEETYRKALQFFWNKYKEDILNSLEFKNYYEAILKEATANVEWQQLQKKENKGRYIFYKSPYAKGALKKIQIKEFNDYLEKFNELYSQLSEKLLSYEQVQLLKDEKILLDWLELAKHTLGILLRFNTKENFQLKDLSLAHFEQVKRYLDLFKKNEYSKNEYSLIIQSFILSEIRGAATLFSKKEYTAKYSVQVVGSDTKFRIFYFKKDENEIDKSFLEERKNLMLPHYYAVALNKFKTKKNENNNALVLNKDNFLPNYVNPETKDYLFRLSSSPYQLQFLDKFLYQPKGWEDISITLSEWSFIVEKRFSIEWDLQKEKPKLQPITEGKKAQKNKLYIAIPFNLAPNKQKQETAPLKTIAKRKNEKEKDLSRINYPILGIDVGEYGLAYCLIKVIYEQEPQKIKAIEISKDEKEKPICGFIEDRNVANIKDKYSEIQKRSKLGVFDESDTIVSIVRENAIGALRNKVHVITVKMGSSIVYEDSISNFETGSGRTTKIYNSIKRADTKVETEADKAEHSHVWGKNTAIIGRNLSAYASSYTCLKCSHSLYEIKKTDLSSMKVSSVDGRILTITTPHNDKTTIKAYVSEKEKYQVDYQFRSNDKEFKIFQKIVRDFARPPVSQNSEVLVKFANNLVEKNKIEIFKKHRGSSSIFVCPFCGFVADADIQAAFIMALRGYLRFSNIVPSVKENKGKTTRETFLEQTQRVLQSINRDEIIKSVSIKL